MCLICCGCGKCIAKSKAFSGEGEGWTEERVLAEAEHFGASTRTVVEGVLRATRDADQAIRESVSILGLTSRFTEHEIDRACAFSLEQVPVPRRKFIQAVLESGTAVD